MDVDRSVASATARSSGNFNRSSDPSYKASENGRNGRQGNVGRSFRTLFKVAEPLLRQYISNWSGWVAFLLGITESWWCCCSATNTPPTRDGSILRTSSYRRCAALAAWIHSLLHLLMQDCLMLPISAVSSCVMETSAPVTSCFVAVCSASGPSNQETRTRSLGGLHTCLSSS